MRHRSLIAVAAAALAGAVLAVAPLAAGSATPAWNIAGAWAGAPGTLTLAQSGGTLTGFFTMQFGCTDTYAVTGSIAGTIVRLDLTRAGGDQMPCAGTQTLNGTFDPSGKALVLALVNVHQASPATPFAGQAKAVAATPAAGTTTAYRVSVRCAGRSQVCAQSYVVNVATGRSTVTVQFRTSAGYCSQARFHLSVSGGQERISGWLGANQATPAFSFAESSGVHPVRVRAEGRPGGRNRGWLSQWDGTLKVTVAAR